MTEKELKHSSEQDDFLTKAISSLQMMRQDAELLTRSLGLPEEAKYDVLATLYDQNRFDQARTAQDQLSQEPTIRGVHFAIEEQPVPPAIGDQTHHLTDMTIGEKLHNGRPLGQEQEQVGNLSLKSYPRGAAISACQYYLYWEIGARNRLEGATASIHHFQPYPFQRRVYEAITSGRSVILQAPTGAGKTRAALIPFIGNLAGKEKVLPSTCYYAVPPRVLANQLYKEHQFLMKNIDNPTSTHPEDTSRQIEREAVAVQADEQAEDVQAEATLTFCSIDQLLAGFLDIAYNSGCKRANLRSSEALSSYLVLDEFHLYSLSESTNNFSARTIAIQMLRLLKAKTPFILMTATFSSALLYRLQALLDAEVISITDKEELAEIDQGRMRTFWRADEPMSAEVILAEHRRRSTSRCTLVVCNTVERAQRLYLQLKRAESEGTRVILLHSRFTTEDLHERSQEVEDELGPEKWHNGRYIGRDLIVVATQVVEVGLNISVQVLHTEIAPASSLIQRAGRCARFAQQQGQVWIYPLSRDDDGNEFSALPYNQDLCITTWNALETFHGKRMGFLQEQVLIDAVYTREDEAFLDQCERHESQFPEQVFASLNTSDRRISSSLMQDIAQVQILIHDAPNSVIREAPWKWESFSVQPSSLMLRSRWQALQKRAAKLGLPVCWEAVPIGQEVKDGEAPNDLNKIAYTWRPITSSNMIPKALMLAFPRQLARYDRELGLMLLDDQLAHQLGTTDYQSTLLPCACSQL